MGGTHGLVGRGELDLPVDAARPQQSRVQDVDPVGGHDDLEEKGGGYRRTPTAMGTTLEQSNHATSRLVWRADFSPTTLQEQTLVQPRYITVSLESRL